MNINAIDQVCRMASFSSVTEEQVKSEAAQEVSAGWPATVTNSCAVCVSHSCQ